MDTIKINRRNAEMIAHRGLSGLETENSIPAFIAAANRSYYGVETDVHVTKDGRFVIIHDDTTERVAFDSIQIEESSYDLVRKIILKDMCPAAQSEQNTENIPVCGQTPDRQDLIVPNLAEYINICKKYGKKCILELKNQFDPDNIRRLTDEILSLNYLTGTVFISFSLENLKVLRQLLPKQELYYLTGEYNETVHIDLTQYWLHLDIYYRTLTKEIIDQLHSEGILVNCWTCDNKEDAERLTEWGVDFITSNILE